MYVLLRACLAAGHLHPNENPSTRGYASTKVATCKSWVMPSAAGRRLMASPAVKPKINGTVTIWTYLYRNCNNVKATSAEVGCCRMDGP